MRKRANTGFDKSIDDIEYEIFLSTLSLDMDKGITPSELKVERGKKYTANDIISMFNYSKEQVLVLRSILSLWQFLLANIGLFYSYGFSPILYFRHSRYMLIRPYEFLYNLKLYNFAYKSSRRLHTSQEVVKVIVRRSLMSSQSVFEKLVKNYNEQV